LDDSSLGQCVPWKIGPLQDASFGCIVQGASHPIDASFQGTRRSKGRVIPRDASFQGTRRAGGGVIVQGTHCPMNETSETFCLVDTPYIDKTPMISRPTGEGFMTGEAEGYKKGIKADGLEILCPNMVVHDDV
jgi:hypothetical protein